MIELLHTPTMPMQRTLSAVFAFVLSASVAVPLSTYAIFRSQDERGFLYENVPSQTERARQNRAALQLRRRQYHQAIELYRELRKRGEEGLVKPDINEPETVEFYLKGATPAVGVPAVTEETPKPSTLQMSDLSLEDKQLLRRYERAGTCPESLRKYIPGFYELCRSLVGEKLHEKPRTGILNDLARLKSLRNILPNTLESRFEMLRQAREGSKRSDVSEPMRTSAPENSP